MSCWNILWIFLQNLETIRKAANDMNVQLERLKKEMNVTETLMNELIELKASTASADWNSSGKFAKSKTTMQKYISVQEY